MKKFKWLLPVLMLALVVTSVAGLFNTAAASPASAPQMAAVSNSTNSQASQPKEVKLDGNKSVDGVACSQIYALGINKQANNRASKIMNECGLGGPEPAAAAQSNAAAAQNPRPSVYGGTDVNTITGAETYPKVTQSESFVWGNANTVVVNYNDSSASPGCYAGVSYSTNGGSTFTRIQPGPFCTGHGTNYGDPTVVWDAALNMWFASDLATGCGGQGIGLWTSTNGSTWVAGSCAHSGTSDDRQSMWVDNNASSPYYGRMYISWNDFAAGQGLFVTHSDNGTTWTSATVFSTFRRDVEITGSPGADGTVILAAMDEGSGGLSNRTNYIYKSTNGGTTWTSTMTGPAFPGPGDGVCSSNSYFAKINPIWRHMGWGQPAVGPANTVHYVYAQHGAGADGGDIYYVRSTDNGATWSVPVKLNTDGTTKAQWMPSLSASAAGAVMAAWFDRRDDSANNNSYKYYGRLSLDGGATWQADAAVSDVLSPQPLQPDSGIQSCYVGDYNYHSFVGNTALLTWVDGRNLISGNSQQDVYFDKVDGTVGTPTPTVTGTPPTATLTSTPTITPTPTNTPCLVTYTRSTSTGASIVPGTQDIGLHTDDGSQAIALPFSFKFYGQNFSSVNAITNGDLQFNSSDTSYINTALPMATFDYAILPHWDDLRTDGTNEGVFTSTTGTAPNRIFNIEWRAEYYSGGATLNFEARLYETTGQIDLIYGVLNGTGASATVGIQKDTGSQYDQFEFNTGGLSQGFEITYLYNDPCAGTATPTATGTLPTATRTSTATDTPIPTNTATSTTTPTSTATPNPCLNYTYTIGAGTIVTGTTDTGNHTDDGVTAITLPFNFNFYGQSLTSANVSSNGNLQFSSTDTAFGNVDFPIATHNNSIEVHWDDLRTDNFTQTGEGIFTSVTGSTPNRIFNIEWRAEFYTSGAPVNFEIRLYETSGQIDMVYGVGVSATSATIGTQKGTGVPYTRFSFNGTPNPVTPGELVSYTIGCGTPTATITGTPPTATSTATSVPPTATVTLAPPTATATQCPSTGIAMGPRITGKGKPAPQRTSTNNTKKQVAKPHNPPNVTWPKSQLVQDPSFEAGTPSPYWTEESTNFGTPLCDDSCGTGGSTAGPNTGTWWVWFGGTVSAEDGAVQQAVTIPNGGATLSFYLWIGNHSGNGATDYMRVLMDGTELFRATDADTQYDAGYVQVSVDVSSYANGGSHTLRLEEHNDAAAAAFNVNVDDVTINTGGGGTCPTLTPTQIGAPTNTPTTIPATATATSVPATNTPPAPTVTATNCPNPFVDINGNVFYNAIMYLYCRGIVNGVDATHYGPAGTASRAQFAKVVVLGFAIPSYTPATPTFTDVPITYFAYQYIEAGFHAGILSGYDAATCAAIGAAFPCYGPNRPITRGQLTKLVVVAGNCPLFTPTSGQTFTDVGPSNVFFAFIESAHNAGVINGYPDNTFRPNNNIRRDEMAQIVYKAILNCPGQGSNMTMTPTAVAPTNTTVPATNTVAPATSTAVPATNTVVPATNTAVPPTNTAVPPTNTAVPPTNTPAPTATSTPGVAMVTIAGFAYSPATITVSVGTTVTWHNNDNAAHTVTSDTAGQFDSGSIANGGDYSFQFTTAGTYPYHCTFHGSMHGTVIVTP